MSLIRRENVSVWSTEVIGISISGVDILESFGFYGTVHLHLKGGGQIDINHAEPVSVKLEWERLLGWTK